MSDVLLGIDLGTSSSKAVLADLDGTILASATVPRPHSMRLPRAGWAEVDPEAVWWADVITLSRQLVAAAGGRPIAGLCVSGVGPCLVLCDESDRPTRPAILYGVDTRAVAEIAELTGRIGGADPLLDRAGKTLSSQAVGPKALWVRRNEPQVWAESSRWYNSSSYIVRKLTGAYVLDHHTASQCDPAYDLRAYDWHDPWARLAYERLPMPELAWPSQIVGTVTGAAAAETGLPAGTPVCAGTVDAWAESFSAGVRRPGDVMLMYGSTMFFVQVLKALTTHPQLWTTTGVDPGTYTLAAGMATSGTLTTWIADLAGGVPYATLIAEAAQVPAGAEGLLMLPYFAGERTPIFDPRARGVIAGLTLRHTRGHLFRAAYEGIAFGIRQILEVLDSSDEAVRRIVAVGGGTRGDLWTRIVSDVTGREQVVPSQTIGASYGDALLAGIGTGLLPPSTDWAREDHLVTPDSTVRPLYDDLYGHYCELYPLTRPLAHHLATLQEGEGAPAP